jgi:RNA polymerase sigma factor (TIGR02999 family)
VPVEADVTGLLKRWRAGDDGALEDLVPLVYDELRRLARLRLRNERQGHSWQPTALVNEAFLKLVDIRRIDWQDRTHFLSMAARVMRRVLVDRARARLARKRAGDVCRVTFAEDLPISDEGGIDLLALDLALEGLAKLDPRKCRVVELRFFAGLSVEETATALSVSPNTVMRDWRLAKTWLLAELREGGL